MEKMSSSSKKKHTDWNALKELIYNEKEKIIFP